MHRLSEQLAYLYTDGGRYWYDIRPNVNREAADRAQQLDREEVLREIERRLKDHAKSRGEFTGVHTAPVTSADVPDERSARLVLLPPDATYRRADENNEAQSRAAEILEHRGGSPRRYRNMLVFLAADQRGMENLEKSARQYLAWSSILDERERLNLDAYGARQAEAARNRADETTEGRLDVLVKPDAAQRQQDEDVREQEEREGREEYPQGNGRGEAGAGYGEGIARECGAGEGGGDAPPRVPAKCSFHGSVELRPEAISGKIGDIEDGVLQHLTSVFGSKVRVRLEIEADIPEGAPERVVFNVEENCRQFGFDSHGFEE